MPNPPTYDVFIAYSPAEEDWVHVHLKPDLTAAGLAVATQEDFTPGRPRVDNWERTLAASRRLLLVITPAWLDDNWQGFAGHLAHQSDVSGVEGRVIPLLYQPTPELPNRLARLEAVDFTNPTRREREWPRLLSALGVEKGVAPGDLPTDHLPPHAPLPPGSRMPYGRNPLFTGREPELLALAGALRAGSSVAIGQIAAATGLGGIGKSQTAVEFVHRYGRFFAGGVFWLSFANPASVLAEVAACGDFPDLPLPEQAALVQRRWQEATPRLLVFDNCEAEELLDRWRPRTGGCRVLVTSRRAAWDPVLGVQTLALGVRPRPESVAFLHKFRPDLAADDPALHALAGELGDLPLALHLAGSYLHRYRHSVTPAAYRDDLRRVDILNHPSLQSGGISPTGHEQHVARTFALSLDRLNPDDSADALALALLQRAACFAPGEPIPRGLLLSTLEERDRGPQTADGEEATAVGGPSSAVEALLRLSELGLLDEADDGAVQMHRLLVAFVGQGEEAVGAVEQSLLSEAQRINRVGYPRPLLAWQPHLRHVTDRALFRKDEIAANLGNDFGYHLRVSGDFRGAQPYCERALMIWKEVLGFHHPDTATGLNNLGHLMQAMGNLSEAQFYHTQALTVRENILGRLHPDTAQSLNNLGMLLDAMGNLTGALPYLEEALAIVDETLGSHHPETAQSLNNLGYLPVAIREEILGLYHPDTAQSLSNLGYLLQMTGDLRGARFYCERAVAILEDVLSPHHPDTATCLNNLGAVLHAMGDLSGALPYYEQALAIRQETLGVRHPDTAQSLNSLGYLQKALGNLSEAWLFYEQALTILEERLGLEHPNTRIVRGNLAALLAEMEEGDSE
jgi:tetratricopeptide (TPR) repeat protein